MNNLTLRAKFITLISAVFIVATLLLLAFPHGASAQPLVPVSLQLRWLHQFQFAGYYAALHKGYYREAGLDVTLKEGGPGADPVADVLAGKSDFGIGVSSLVIDYLKGKPVLLLGPVFQHSPNILVVHGHNQKPDDLADAGSGKRKIALMKGDQDIELKAMFLNEGIALDKLRIVPDEHNMEDFLNHRVDAINAYLSNEPFVLDQLGIPYTMIRPYSYGMDFYGDVLFTRKEMETSRPEVVAAFRAASMRGWHYALDHPREIIDLILERYNSQKKSREHLAYEARELHRLINPEVIEIGHNNPGRWLHIANTYKRFGLADFDKPLDNFFYRQKQKVDLTRFYWALAVIVTVLLVVGGIAIFIHRINRRLAVALEEKSRSEERMRESIEYARIIQNSILPANELFERSFAEWFIIYKPCDIVGGDFYWLRENAGQILLAVIDCTGHGVPGAFMTMTVNSVLNQIVDTIGVDDPARILNEMNRILQKTLRLRQGEGRTVDAGLDIAICFIDPVQGRMIFAGAGISLYVVSHGTLHEVKGDRQRVGYRTSDINYTYTSHPLSIEPGVNYFAASDGYFDEGGGAEGYSFGNDRFENMLKQHADLSLKEQGRLLEQALNEWRGSRKQRDDITMVGFNF